MKAVIDSFTNTNVSDAYKTGGDLRFRTRPDNGNLTERLRITSDGDVGIGVADPDVYSLGGSNRYAAIKASAGYTVLNLVDSNNSGSYLQFGNSSVRRGSLHFESNSDFVITSNANNSGTTLTERLRITSDGNVRISDEHLRFDTSGKGIIFGANGGNNRPSIIGTYNSSSDNYMVFNVTGSERLRIGSAGQIGLGS